MKNKDETQEVRDWGKLDKLDAAHAARDAAIDAWDDARKARDSCWVAYTAICSVTRAAEANASYHNHVVDLAVHDDTNNKLNKIKRILNEKL